jgi:acetyl-CoA C-acetyltransferase
MPRAFLMSAVRTPIGKFLGGLADCPAPQLGGLVVAEALRRAEIPAERVDEVIMGHVLQAGVGQNPGRQAALQAGLPPTIAAVTINKVCGSGLKAVMLAAQAIRAGDAQIVAAGGMESMSRAPFLLAGARAGWKFGDQKAIDSMAHDGLTCPFEHWPMGEAADYIAQKHDVSRAEQDRFAERSQRRAATAWEEGLFAQEVLPVTSGTGPKAKTVNRDESVRPRTVNAILS